MQNNSNGSDIETVKNKLDRERYLPDDEQKDVQHLANVPATTTVRCIDIEGDCSGVDAEEFTSEEYRRLVRKIDFIVLPVMWLCSGIQQADKTSISSQAVFGLTKELNMVGQQFAWLGTIFYLGYMVAEGPVNWLMQRWSIKNTLAMLMIIWGLLVGCIGAAQSWETVLALRAIQGAAESAVTPALLLLTAAWYKTEEHSLRALIWGTANAGMSIIISLSMYGIAYRAQANMDGLAAWRCIALFLGPLTVLLGIGAFFVAGTPHEVPFLSDREKRIATARITSNNGGSGRQRTPWSWEQFWDTFRDPQIYIFFALATINALPNGGTTSFGNLIYLSFGFTPLETLLKGLVVQNILSILYFLFIGYITRKWRHLRLICMMFSVVPAFIGMLCVSLLPKTPDYLWIKYGCYLMTVTGTLPGLIVFTMLPSNVAGRTKKSAVGTALFIGYCAGNAAGSQIFQSQWAPDYTPAIGILAALYGLEFVLMAMWRQYYIASNKRRQKAIEAASLTIEQIKMRGQKLGEEDVSEYVLTSGGEINLISNGRSHRNAYFMYDY